MAGINVYDSLRKEVIPLNLNDKKYVTWYCCGPTVYDSAHMGHARAYITFDIIRRILTDYFGYFINYVMNITDIDDKIIARAKKDHLYQCFLVTSQKLAQKELCDIFEKSVSTFKNKLNDATLDEDTLNYFKKSYEAALLLQKNFDQHERKDFLENPIVQDMISAYLLEEPALSGVSDPNFFTDHKLYTQLTEKHIAEFNNDMCNLNVLQPTLMPKISDFVVQVVDFIQHLIDNGSAYMVDESAIYGGENKTGPKDSVYFDVQHHMSKTQYPKLLGTTNTNNDSEKKIIERAERRDKCLDKRDFALWKTSKPGEPSWPSPWGEGRPGWHIECSTMAGYIFGEHIDIHSGGVDLKFPHHDNEIAQSEARYDTDEWVRYFLHAGHLTIEGQKMSKSLKNFISIRQALTMYTPRQIRLTFLTHRWNGPLDFSTNVMNNSKILESYFCQWFMTMQSWILSDSSGSFNESNFIKGESSEKDEELKLIEKVSELVTSVDVSLRSNFDTPSAVHSLKQIVSACYNYTNNKKEKGLNMVLLVQISNYVAKMLNMFGLSPAFAVLSDGKNINLDSNKDKGGQEQLYKLAQALCEFRHQVRKVSKSIKNVELLQLCDKIRDEELAKHGFVLEDKDNLGSFALKFLTESLEGLKIDSAQKVETEGKSVEKETKNLTEIDIKMMQKVAVKDFFRVDGDKYSKFELDGENYMPTHDKEGNELSKAQKKKNVKLLQLYQKKCGQKN